MSLSLSAPRASRKGVCTQLEAAAECDTAHGIIGGAASLGAGGPAPSGAIGLRYRRARVARGAYSDAFSVNSMLAWNRHTALTRATTLAPVGAQASTSVGAAIVRNAYPFNVPGTSVIGLPSIRYFEVTIDAACGDPYVALGVVSEKMATRHLQGGMHLGCYSGPWEGSFEVRRCRPSFGCKYHRH